MYQAQFGFDERVMDQENLRLQSKSLCLMCLMCFMSPDVHVAGWAVFKWTRSQTWETADMKHSKEAMIL